MGMFDHLRCKYPLPTEVNIEDMLFQTKDTPRQFMDSYEIREDGTLWHETYDIEDQSDPKAIGFSRFIGCMTKVNQQWEFEKDFIGEIRFYTMLDDDHKTFIEFSSYFVDGKLKEIHLIGEAEDEDE